MYAELSTDATIEEAMDAMAAKPGREDVYVTRDGVGEAWFSNVCSSKTKVGRGANGGYASSGYCLPALRWTNNTPSSEHPPAR